MGPRLAYRGACVSFLIDPARWLGLLGDFSSELVIHLNPTRERLRPGRPRFTSWSSHTRFLPPVESDRIDARLTRRTLAYLN